MRVRHYFLGFAIVLTLAFALAGCQLLGFWSISDRITQFQTDLNTSGRLGLYLDFHPDQCSDFNALKDPTTTFNSLIPLGTGYSLTITDQSDSSAVLVTISGGGFGSPHYLKLSMATTGIGDNRIVKLWLSTSTTFNPGPDIQ
jgi:hypothetical protein